MEGFGCGARLEARRPDKVGDRVRFPFVSAEHHQPYEVRPAARARGDAASAASSTSTRRYSQRGQRHERAAVQPARPAVQARGDVVCAVIGTSVAMQRAAMQPVRLAARARGEVVCAANGMKRGDDAVGTAGGMNAR